MGFEPTFKMCLESGKAIPTRPVCLCFALACDVTLGDQAGERGRTSGFGQIGGLELLDLISSTAKMVVAVLSFLYGIFEDLHAHIISILIAYS